MFSFAVRHRPLNSGGFMASLKSGSDVVAGYGYSAEVEYIETTGTQYFDTGITVSGDTRIEVQASVNDTTNTGGIWCARDVSGGTILQTFTLFCIAGGATGRFDYSNQVQNTFNYSDWYTRHAFKAEANNFYIDDTLIASPTYASYQITDTLKIFASNNSSDGTTITNYLKGRLYSVKIWDDTGETLLHDFIPVRVNRECCLYDNVTGELLWPIGGSCNYGADVRIPVRPEGVRDSKIKPVLVKYEMSSAYAIHERNDGVDPVSVQNVKFPSTRFTALNYTPTFADHRFVGWDDVNPDAYVKDGLIHWWDAIWNSSEGVFDGSATVWNDLVGDLDISLPSSATWETGALRLLGNTTASSQSNFAFDSSKDHTVEIIFMFGRHGNSLNNVWTHWSIGRLTAAGWYSRWNDQPSPNQYVYWGANRVFDVSASYNHSNGWNATAPSILATFLIPASGDATLYYDYDKVTRTLTPGTNKTAAPISITLSGNLPSYTYAIRVYDRLLTSAERKANFIADCLRFRLDSTYAQTTPFLSYTEQVPFTTKNVYSVWQQPIHINLDVNGGTMPSEWVKPLYYGGQNFSSLPTPTPPIPEDPEEEQKKFIGWFCPSSVGGWAGITNNTQVTTSTKVPECETTLQARYLGVTYASTFEVTTTSSYRKCGFYSITLKNSAVPVVIDWGDGSVSTSYSTISQLVHQYSSNGTFIVSVSDNANVISMSADNSTWYQTTSQNYYTVTKVNLSGVTSVANHGFRYLNALTHLNIPATVTSIGSYAFYYCQSLGYITFESGGSLTLGTYCFDHCMRSGLSTGMTLDMSGRTVTTLPNAAFNYCSYLSNFIWPQGVQSIGQYTFQYCFNAAAATGTIEIPEGVTKITSTYAFRGCAYLTKVVLPSTLTTFNQYAFSACPRLVTIEANRTTAPTINANNFGNSTSTYTGRNTYSAGTNKLIVPDGATGYTAGGWATLLDSTKCGFTLEYSSNS